MLLKGCQDANSQARLLCGECLGELGAIDPGRLDFSTTDTQGKDFIYLQFWFLKEKNPNFVPIFEDISESKKQLNFVKHEEFHHTGKEREIFVLLQNTFE